jgi:glucose-6-phosphate dehydrogenase assembly protein OpcA
MAPAVSEVATPEPAVEWRSDDASIGDVIGALNGLRRTFARAEAGDEEHPHPRNCVMTLIAIAASDAEERRAQRATREIGRLHPAQLLVIRDNPSLRSGQIRASISTDTQRPASACAVQCEQITLHVRGGAGDHLAALVDPLLTSGVPTYMWWVGTPPFGKRELEDALHVCDALVVDSARFGAPFRSFLELCRLAGGSHRRLGLADLQWSRLNPWRETVAQFFSPAARRPLLDGISAVGIDYAGEGRGNRIAGAMLVGWLASCLGWKLKNAAAGAGGVVAANFVAEGWRPVQVAFRSVSKPHLMDGEIGTFRLVGAAGGVSFQLTVMRDPERVRSSAPDIGAGAFRSLHAPGGEDEAGLEIAQRSAQWHRDVRHESLESLHHTATGDAPGDSVPPQATVFVRERRRSDNPKVLLTMIDIGGADTLRHVQRVETEDEAVLLVGLLSNGGKDPVYMRALAGAFELMQSI